MECKDCIDLCSIFACEDCGKIDEDITVEDCGAYDEIKVNKYNCRYCG